MNRSRASRSLLNTLLLGGILISSLSAQSIPEQIAEAALNSGRASERRALFLPDNLKEFADTDLFIPLPQGGAVPTLQFVERCAELLGLDSEKNVLVLGRATGYTAAVLADRVKTVYAAELVAGLPETYEKIQRDLGLENIVPVVYPDFVTEEDFEGFDAILLHGITEKISASITGMLRAGGSMLVPLVDSLGVQEVLLMVRKGEGWELSTTGLSVFPTTPIDFEEIFR